MQLLLRRCDGAGGCIEFAAVLGIQIGIAQNTLIEHWNGSAWSIVPSPNAAGQFAAFMDQADSQMGQAMKAAGFAKA